VEVERWCTLASRTHFDYECGPLFRLLVFRISALDYVLFYGIHHIAFDGWSRSILISEISALYQAFREERPSPLAPLTVQYQDFARWQRQTLTGELLDSQVTFWREHLRGSSSLDLQGGRPLPARRTYAAGLEAVTIPQDLARRLEAFGAEHGLSLFMTLFTAFNLLLFEETGQEDIVIICLFANRNQAEIENLIGNFYAGLPLRTRLSGAASFRALLERVREVTLAAHEHPDILYEPVFEGLSFHEKGDLATFRIVFQLAKLPPGRQAWSDLQVTGLPFDSGTMRKDLSLFLSQSDQITGRFRYNRDILDPERVQRMHERYLRILEEIVQDPEHPFAAPPAG
jgi:hypothetical protein